MKVKAIDSWADDKAFCKDCGKAVEAFGQKRCNACTPAPIPDAELVDALDKMLLAACWFHEGPYGPSPSIDDYHAAQATFQRHRAHLAASTTSPPAVCEACKCAEYHEVDTGVECYGWRHHEGGKIFIRDHKPVHTCKPSGV